ncbi:MAG: hypothetical protein K2M43_02840 [Mycoplasmoidaceae bacterium]|nr:hypothetical protein [Mycoplasmoidaceae bacterium]
MLGSKPLGAFAFSAGAFSLASTTSTGCSTGAHGLTPFNNLLRLLVFNSSHLDLTAISLALISSINLAESTNLEYSAGTAILLNSISFLLARAINLFERLSYFLTALMQANVCFLSNSKLAF